MTRDMTGETTAELEWKGRTGPFTIRVNPGVFAPTHTSRTIAEALEIAPGDTVIDVGCGISGEAVEVARGNARLLGLEDRVEFRVGSLLDPVRGERANVIIGDVSGIP